MTVKTQLKAGRLAANHSEALQVRSTLKAGKLSANHSEALRIVSARQFSPYR